MSKDIKKILIISITFLIVLRIFSLLLIPHLPHLERYKYNNYFSALNSGDDLGYHLMAKMIYKSEFDGYVRTLGFPLMITPFIFVFGGDFFDIFLPVVLFHSVILFSLSIIMIVLATFSIFRKIIPAIASGFLFIVFPFVFYIFRSYGPQFKTGAWNDLNFFDMHWLAAMSDQPAAFFALLILFLLIVNIKKEFSLFFCGLLGFLAGFSTMIRISNVMIAFSAGLIIFLCQKIKKYKKLFFYGLFACLGFLPQFVYNIIFFGSPISFGYWGEKNNMLNWNNGADSMIWDFSNFFHIIARAIDYSWLIIPVFLSILSVVVLGLLYIRKFNKPSATAVVLWFLLPVLFYMFFETGQTTIRYYLSAVPPFVILFVAALMYTWAEIRLCCHRSG